MTITLDHNKQTAKITSVDKQVVYINKLGFLTNDENWVDRIFSSSLTIQLVDLGIRVGDKILTIREIIH